MPTPRATPGATDERGAVTVIVAALLPVLLLVSAFGMDALAVSAGEREHQRAADLGALTAAAAIPLVNLSALPPGGGAWPAAADAATLGCTVARDLLDDSPATRAWRQAPSGCVITFEPDDPDLLTLVNGAVGGVVAASSVLAALGASTAELAASLVPAVAAPRARAWMDSALQPPLTGLTGTALASPDIEQEAVARRRLKNALLLPVLQLDGACAATGLLGAVTTVTGPLSGILASAPTVGAVATQLRGCEVDANPALAANAATLFGGLTAAGARLDGLGLPGTPIATSLVRDLRDLADPSGAAGPTQGELLAAAAQRDEHVLVVMTGVTSATGIPILDVFPVLADDLMGRDLSRLQLADLFGLMAVTTQARGLFRATLVQ
jgi:hypothetical protein